MLPASCVLSVYDYVQYNLFGAVSEFFIYQKPLDIDAASRDRFTVTADSSESVVINARICKTEKCLLPNSKCYYAHYYLKRSKSQKVKSRLRRGEIRADPG